MDLIKKTFKKGNKRTGLLIILFSLLMLLSITIFTFGYNPFYFVQAWTLMQFFGNGLTVIIWLLIIWIGIRYYLEVQFSFLTKKRELMFFLVATIVILLLSNIFIEIKLAAPVSLKVYYDTVYFDNFDSWQNNMPNKWIPFNLIYIGVTLPLTFWLIGGWGYGILTGVLLLLTLIYSIYVITTNDYEIFFARFEFWKSKEDKILTTQKTKALDLNMPTEEFELNFSKEEKEKIKLIEKVRKNMDTKNYDELSKKIKVEREKLIALRKKILEKSKAISIENKSKSKTTEAQKKDILATLGYISYSKMKKLAETKSLEQIRKKEEFKAKKILKEVKEEESKENISLIKEGYKTTEQSIDISKPDLSDDFINDIADEISRDHTQEVPLLQEYYDEIFAKENELIKEINKTIETIIDFEEENKWVDNVIITNLAAEVTVEQYISLPEEIEKKEDTKELKKEYLSKEEDIWDEELIEETEEIEIKKVRSPDWCNSYILPSTSILSNSISSFDGTKLVEEATNKAKQLNEVFESFGVDASVHTFEIGPTITVFKITLESGIKTTKVTNLEDNLKLTLGAEYIRIIAPIPGTSFMGIEVPNSIKKPVPFKVVYDETPDTKNGIQISIGQDVSGKSLFFDLTKAPHLLVAGSTGSGKSVAINTILASILLRYKPTDVQLILIDPKMVEFAPFHDVPHLMAEVITDSTNANNALKAMVDEMENRYKIMATEGVKKIDELNEKLISQGKTIMPYIVVIIDELADLMMTSAKEVEESIMRITQKARAAGIHMVLATQRPSTEIITGTIKSNIPSRMSFTVASSIDSRTILGQIGAEKLIGMGDMLVSLYGQLPFRGQGAYISNEEVEDITAFAKSQCNVSYVIDVEKFSASLNNNISGGSSISVNDPMYIAARDTVIHHQKASTSMLQRHLNIGYNKAANIIEKLESEGVISASKGSKPRKVLEDI